jgi:hypothetical protein
MWKALKTWAASNENAFPKHVITFRDGVSDADLDVVKAEEGDRLLKAVNELANETTFAFIAIKKKVNTRELIAQLRAQGITNIRSLNQHSKIYPEFFVCPAHTTVLRTHFVVLNNEPQLPLDTLQDCAYCQTYLTDLFGTSGLPIVSQVSLDSTFSILLFPDV